jgi:hypothetical protein
MEMLLDLNALMHMILRKSETEKMYRLIRRYKDYIAAYFNNPMEAATEKMRTLKGSLLDMRVCQLGPP